ncbi:hypothetical protein [Symbiobacterium thermophilum]|nr:hypothetical protein [Symbiobacterium thermophilum]
MNSPARPNPVRFPLLLLGILTLLAALWAGMLRIGLALPSLSPTLSGGHGPLMISGFLGTVIGLERAVAMGRPWMFAAPALAAAGGLLILCGAPAAAGALSMALSSAALILLFTRIVRVQPTLFNYVLTLAAAVWLGGNLSWLFGTPITHVVPAWAGFLVLTIAGERLELARLVRISRGGTAAFLAVLAVVVAGAALTPFHYSLGWRVTGLGLAALSLWLLRYDIARRTVRTRGLTRFIALCMLPGYFWLLVGGLIPLRYGFIYGGIYDAALHAVFLGFVFSMIFGHAPVIFPAVLGVRMAFTPRFYSHLVLLHLSVLLRVGAGLAEWLPGRQWAVVLNVAAVLLFLLNTVRSVRRKPAQLR